jgi:serine kinase of HPr protein (carbohydrate metabolism regulator)
MLIATAPPEIHNKLYLRELGIINIRHQFGPQSQRAQCQAHLMIQLREHCDSPVNPLEKKGSKTLLTTTLPSYSFNGKDRRLALLVETLCRQVTLESVTDKKDNPC